MDKLFVAALSNYFEKKNDTIPKTATFPALFLKPKSPLGKLLKNIQINEVQILRNNSDRLMHL